MIKFLIRVVCLVYCLTIIGCAGARKPNIGNLPEDQKQAWAALITKSGSWRFYKNNDEVMRDPNPYNWTLHNLRPGIHRIVMSQCENPDARYKCQDTAFVFNARPGFAYFLNDGYFKFVAYERKVIDDAFSNELSKKYALPSDPAYTLMYWPWDGVDHFLSPEDAAERRLEISRTTDINREATKTKIEVRRANQPRIRTVGASVCQQTSETEYVRGWVEAVGSEKIQIRVTNRSKQKEDLIIWDSPMNWDLCG